MKRWPEGWAGRSDQTPSGDCTRTAHHEDSIPLIAPTCRVRRSHSLVSKQRDSALIIPTTAVEKPYYLPGEKHAGRRQLNVPSCVWLSARGRFTEQSMLLVFV